MSLIDFFFKEREGMMLFHKSINLNLILLLCLLLLITHKAVYAETLTIATLEYTGDWNPVRYQTYPALFVVRVTSERLFEQKCAGDGAKTNLFENICQSPQHDLNGNILRFQFNALNCPNCAEDNLSAQDIQFTIEQIRDVKTNSYYHNDFSFEKPPYLQIGKPKNAASYYLKQYLDFPILREKNINLDTTFFTDTEKQYNSITAGHYKIDSIGDHQTILKQRECLPIKKFSITEIKISFYDLFTQLNDSVKDKQRQPHIIMAVPYNFNKQSKDYYFRSTPDLNSFTYVGFNYQCKDAAKQQLFFDEKFRKLFTQSLWKLTPIINKMNIKEDNPESDGIFLGESFDERCTPSNTNEDQLKDQIKRYLSDSLISDLIITIIMSPFTLYQFDETQTNTLEVQLNNFWGPNISFYFKSPVKGKGGYTSLINNNDFEMNFGQFYYGRSPMRYMAFMKQDSPLNILKVPNTLMRVSDIEKCMNSINENGRIKFQKLLQKTFPVAVVGRFRLRDWFSKRIIKQPVCQGNTIQEPYFGVHTWTLKR